MAQLRAVPDPGEFREPTAEETFEECDAIVHSWDPIPPPLRRPAWGDRRYSRCIHCACIREDVFDVNYNRIGSPRYDRPPGWRQWKDKQKENPRTWADKQEVHMRNLRRRKRDG